MKHIIFPILTCVWLVSACTQYTVPTINELIENPETRPEELTVFPEAKGSTDRLVCTTIDYENLINDTDNWDEATSILLENSQMVILGEIQVSTFVDLPYPTIGLNSGPPMSVCYEPNVELGPHVATFSIRGTNRRFLQYSWVFYMSEEVEID